MVLRMLVATLVGAVAAEAAFVSAYVLIAWVESGGGLREVFGGFHPDTLLALIIHFIVVFAVASVAVFVLDRLRIRSFRGYCAAGALLPLLISATTFALTVHDACRMSRTYEADLTWAFQYWLGTPAAIWLTVSALSLLTGIVAAAVTWCVRWHLERGPSEPASA
ncbi:hypothetical protein [Caulobacter sp. 17J80-11]|uniref:hypothetical protein n=1 Tax=Caulobacter sp. 17J80-11 TaxID=2763502 RepID=UPI0016534C23|nr:hypothetical protein [Caulobacter sp. 17J80-11]MBC6982168.1 hypothetical protein [Caulobacter sp. 17J80-11]